jgi:MFS family permease
MIFLWSTVFGVADIHFHYYVPDVPKPPRRVEVLGAFSRPFRNRQFIWFVAFVGTLIFAFSFIGQFLTLYLIEQVHVTDTSVQMITLVAPMLGQLVVFSVWGMAADRMGKKPVIALAALGMVPVGVGWCALTPGNSWWLGYVVSTAAGIFWCGIEVTNLNLVLELSVSPSGEIDSSFIAVNSVMINIAGLAGALASGWIATVLKNMHWQPMAGLKVFTFFDVLFVLSAVLRLVAVVIFLPHIKEPLARGKREALRFMTANIYNNIFNAIAQPLRLVGLGRQESAADGDAKP